MKVFLIKIYNFCLLIISILSFVALISIFRYFFVSETSFNKMVSPELIIKNKTNLSKQFILNSIQNIVIPEITSGKLIDIDINKIKDNILKLSWINNVAVIRDYPNLLKVVVECKNIVAYKLNNGFYYPIGENSEIMNIPFANPDNLVVFGEEAELYVNELISELKKYPSLMKNIVGAQFVNGLRWNLFFYSFDDGLLVKLDDDLNKSILKLAELDMLYGILNRDILEINLRDLDNILVKR